MLTYRTIYILQISKYLISTFPFKHIQAWITILQQDCCFHDNAFAPTTTTTTSDPRLTNFPLSPFMSLPLGRPNAVLSYVSIQSSRACSTHSYSWHALTNYFAGHLRKLVTVTAYCRLRFYNPDWAYHATLTHSHCNIYYLHVKTELQFPV